VYNTSQRLIRVVRQQEMRRQLKALAKKTGIGCLLLLAAIAGWLTLRTHDPHFICHRELFGAFAVWQTEATNTQWYPNIDGDQSRSLAVLESSESGICQKLSDYRYVPGLRNGDPDDLIMLYVNRPSRRTWHGDGHFLRLRKRWVVLGPSMMSRGASFTAEWSECGEALSTTDFKRRLSHTLDYLRENNRTNRACVIQDHGAFLRTVQD